MKFFHLVSIATYIVLCYAQNYEYKTQLIDVTTGVGNKVDFLCRLNTTQEEEFYHQYIVWSINNVIINSGSTNGMYSIDSVPASMNNSIVQCSFFSSVTTSATLILIGQPDTPILYIVTRTHSSVTMDIDIGNTKGSPISEIRITLPSRIWNHKVEPPKWSVFEYKISNLYSDTGYAVRVRCWNGYMWSQEGTVKVTTLPNQIVSQTQTQTTFNSNTTEIPSNANQSIASFYTIFLLLLVLLLVPL